MRRLIAFSVAGHDLLGTLDEAPGRTGILIVSGGNEPRMGAHRGMTMLAADLVASGMPVFRFDRRGVGDSAGENGGFLTSGPDIAAALETFRRERPAMTRVVGVGNCDAASALALFGRAAGVDSLILANPWLRQEADSLPPAAAIRARYRGRLRDPAAWWRFVRGKVDLGKMAAGLRKLGRSSPPDDLAVQVLAAIGQWSERATIVLASGDATALAFIDAAKGHRFRTVTIDTASHSFAGADAAAALRRILLDAAHGG